MQNKYKEIICLCGNDGTGKSTLIKLIGQLYPEYHVIERSTPQKHEPFEKLRKQIKHIDFLTYRYSFETEREDFQPSHSIEYSPGVIAPVNWIMLDLDPQIIAKRIKNREQMGIFQSKKCVQYYSFVYRELAIFYGMTIIDVSPAPLEIVKNIREFIESSSIKQIRSLALKNLTYEMVNQWNAESQIKIHLTESSVNQIINLQFRPFLQKSNEQAEFYLPQINTYLNQGQLLYKQLALNITARWVITNGITKTDEDQLKISYNSDQINVQIPLKSPLLVHLVEGQSKRIYKVISKNQKVQDYYKEKIIIILKSTIYSHTNQHTGQILNLGEIRAFGSNLFLEMLRRNNLHHAYYAVNKRGIIVSRLVQTNYLEIVFKKELIGTDKHSYFGMSSVKEIAKQDLRYSNGIYVRFDWRNPNHQLKKYLNFQLNLCPYYYIIERVIGKQKFFEVFLKKQNVKPLGDKCISEDIVQNYVRTQSIKKAVLSLYCAFTYYCSRVGLEIIDGCCMFNKDGSMAWSQINPDCMRVKTIMNENVRKDYDKDIWRAGGSSSKEAIKQKWSLFNKILAEYFVAHRFHQTELLETSPLSYPMNQEASRLLNQKQIILQNEYRSLFQQIACCTQSNRELIGTIDIKDSKPTLVKSSEFSQNHSESVENAYQYIGILPKIVMVDLDAAMNKTENNAKLIKKFINKNNSSVYAVGGGIRTEQVLNFYLKRAGAHKIILSSNLELLQKLSSEEIQQKVIVELSINQKNEILTHGRTINTGVNVITKIVELSRKNVKTISLTFNHKQGHLAGISRNQFRDIMFCIPGKIQKVIIAGGITTLEDLDYIWGFPKAVPQLGSAIWKNKISISDIYQRLVNFNKQKLIPAIIVDHTGVLLGQVFMNKQALSLTCQQRFLYRFSRKLGRVIKKGEESGNTQKVLHIKPDCDNDCLQIIVQESTHVFCHNKCKSCFNFENQVKIQNIESLQNHILRKKDTGSGYSKKLQQNEHLAKSKFLEESEQLCLTSNRQVEEGADVVAHLLMYLNSKGISFGQIMQELQVRSRLNKPKLNSCQRQQKYIGVIGGKHFEKIDIVLEKILGISLIRSDGRSLKIDCKIADEQKLKKYEMNTNIKLLGIKSKDMASLLKAGYIQWCFNYSIMMQNYPQIWKQIIKQPIEGIKLVLLKKIDANIDPKLWTSAKKGVIITEYPFSTNSYFNQLGVDQTCYKLIKVGGGTESYLHTDMFDYCDAIVQSGKTVEANNLQVAAILCETIYGGLYTLA